MVIAGAEGLHSARVPLLVTEKVLASAGTRALVRVCVTGCRTQYMMRRQSPRSYRRQECSCALVAACGCNEGWGEGATGVVRCACIPWRCKRQSQISAAAATQKDR